MMAIRERMGQALGALGVKRFVEHQLVIGEIGQSTVRVHTAISAIESYLRCPRYGAERTIYSAERTDDKGESHVRVFTLTVGDVGHKERARLLKQTIEDALAKGRAVEAQKYLDSLLEATE